MKGTGGDVAVGVPRLLLVGLERINASDSSGNGLLMRSLLTGWPRQELAQIYSSGHNGDAGIAGQEFQVGADERACGRLFIIGKREVQAVEYGTADVRPGRRLSGTVQKQIVHTGCRYLGETGLYELLFPVRLSPTLTQWVDRFRPDVILAQGYSLGAVRLALLLKEYSGARLASFWSDDWPVYTYAGSMGEPRFASRVMHPIIVRDAARLVAAADVAFAFGPLMAREYEFRYSRPFIVINHSDDPLRFREAPAARNHSHEVVSLLVAGTVDRFRAPSILDLNAACRLLEVAGVRARVCLMASTIATEVQRSIREAEYVDIVPVPGHADLPGHLKGADILVMAESFDEKVADAQHFSISSKAHLFMLSERPIIVYASAAAGLARYATEAGWAEVVTERDPSRLAAAIKALLAAPERQDVLIRRARQVAEANHDAAVNRALFVDGLTGKRPAPTVSARGFGRIETS
jgi:glycosyltransferase involved in cell wall biosynthesis